MRKNNTKKVIFTLHDFGKTRSINKGTIYALEHEHNIATECSLMPNGLASMEAARYARQNPDIAFNLCITLTDFSPVGKGYKTLTDSKGLFLKVNTKTWDFSVLNQYSDKEIAQEIQTQYDWFLKHVGRKPTALTTQKSEHGDPKILTPLVELAKKENLPIRTPAWKWFSNYAAQAYVNDLGIVCSNNVFVGIKDWKGENGYSLEEDKDLLVERISSSPGISDVLLMAGFVDKELLKISSVTWQRGEYLNLLERKPDILKQYKVKFKLISYRDL